MAAEKIIYGKSVERFIAYKWIFSGWVDIFHHRNLRPDSQNMSFHGHSPSHSLRCGSSKSSFETSWACTYWIHFFSSELDVSISLIARLSVA